MFELLKFLYATLPVVDVALNDHIWESFKVRDGSTVNKTHLIHQYELICPVVHGRGYAAGSDLVLPNKICMQDYSRQTLNCHCNEKCGFRGPVGYLMTTFFGTEVYPSPNEDKSYIMVEGCPYEYFDDVKQNCEETTILPVSSIKSGLTYKNRFCAQCHNENTLLDWKLGLTCPNDTTPESNAYGNCSIKMFPPDKILAKEMQCHYRISLPLQMISKCNETGLWRHFDADIEWACHHFHHAFRQFKNIYCYICNPGIISNNRKSLLSTCSNTRNSTGLFSPLNGDYNGYYNDSHTFERMCNIAEITPRLSPFRNVFCYLCNKPATSKEYDDIGEFKVAKTKPEYFLLKITLNDPSDNHLIAEEFVKKLKRLLIIQELINSTDTLSLNKEQIKLNFRMESKIPLKSSHKLLQSWINVCTKERTCSKSALENKFTTSSLSCDTCSCKQKCLLLNYLDCCFDKLMAYRSYSCIPESSFPVLRQGGLGAVDSDSRSFKVFHQCNDGSKSASDISGCFNNDSSDAWSSIPVVSSNNLALPFRNIYCLACSKDIPKHKIFVYLKVTCRVQFELDLFLDWKDIIESLKDHKCKLSFTLDEDIHLRATCLIDTNKIHRSWLKFVCFGNSKFDGKGRDIYNLCTNDEHTPHVLTDMSQIHMLYHKQNTLLLNPNISTVIQCRQQNSSMISSEHLCFVQTNPSDEDNNAHKYVPDSGLSYRALFTVLRDELKRFRHLENGHICPDGTADFKTDECHKVYCESNRVLENRSCVNVFEAVLDTSFIITIWLRPCAFYGGGNERFTNNQSLPRTISQRMTLLPDMFLSPADVCREADEKIKNMFDNRTTIRYILCNFHVYNCPSDSNQYNVSAEEPKNRWVISDLTVIQANITVNVKRSGNRSYIERELYYLVKHANLRVSGLRFCPAQKLVAFSKKVCDETDYVIPEDFIDSNSSNNHVFVKKTLFCPTVEIEVESNAMHQGPGTLSFIYSAREIIFPSDSFDILEDDKKKLRVRICEQDFKRLTISFKVRKKHNRVYFLFSTCCNLISVLSLVLTLLTYSIFKVLRTIPGRNNMSLALCLLLAQSSLQYSYISDLNNDLHCQILGVCIHYFWLGTFCALNVCSFHMYRVFSEGLISRPDHDVSCFIRYTVYVYGTPALAVSAVGIVNSVTRGTIGYGEILCFLDEFYSVVIGFLIPSCLIFASNVVFYGVTFYKINSCPTLQRNVEERNMFSIYIRLCTITGVAWPLLFVDALFSLTVLSYVVTFLNALQGFFIFISFICNRRVIDLYKGYISGREERDTGLSGLGRAERTRSVQ